MAGIASYINFVDELKQLYVSKRHSNVQLKVFEDSKVTQVIDAHAIVLEMNSIYFQNLLKDHKKGEIEFEIKLKSGEGKFMEIIISGFYDKDLLNDLSASDYLCLLELGVTYTNDEFVKYILKHIEDMEVDDNVSRSILTTIYSMEHDGNFNVELIIDLKAKCTKVIAELFSPIEMKHEGFLELEYAPLLYLLQSDELFSISENSLLAFIILWLEYDKTRQKGSLIECLLKSLRVKFLGADYLYSTITMNHVVLNKWDGFSGWIFDCIGVQVISASQRLSKFPNFDTQVSRNVENGIHSWYKIIGGNYLNAIRWLVRMTPEIASEKFGPTKHTFIHDGINFYPTLVSITAIEGDNNRYNMILSINCSGSVANIRFVVGIVLADKDHDISTIFFGSEFARSFLKWSDAYTFNANTQVLDYWTASKDFVHRANKHGLYVCLLPVTDDEFHNLQTLKFGCDACKYGSYLAVLGRCTYKYCQKESCSTNIKIYLT